MLPIQCEAQDFTFLTSSQVLAMILVYRPHFTKRHKRLLKLISAVIDKTRYKLFPNNKQCQTLGGGKWLLSCSVLLLRTCWLIREGEIDDAGGKK